MPALAFVEPALKAGDRRESDHYSVEMSSLGAGSRRTKVPAAKKLAALVWADCLNDDASLCRLPNQAGV